MSPPGSSGPGPLDILERFRKPRPRPGEQCEMCATEIGTEHSHVVNLESRGLMCACRPCYLLFLPGGAAGGRYKSVPDRCVELPEATLTRGDWESLQVPVGIAFFFFSSTTGEVHCFYPGPAGATESLLPLDMWERLRAAEPLVASIEADVEALLVRAEREGDPASYIVPIDACYELVGYLRMYWKGFDGGGEAHQAIDDFFAGVVAKASSPVRHGAPPWAPPNGSL
ncbi:MAG: DUF5947 family protein [Actinomycetota bacterium]|jgi:hypothetical protein